MGLGYAKIITKAEIDSLENWLLFLEKEFLVHRSINGEYLFTQIDNEGEKFEVARTEIFDIFERNGIVILRVENAMNEALNCAIQASRDSYYFFEEYSLDQLVAEISQINTFDILFERYRELRNKKLGVGFIYDENGYSEDYINFLV